MFFSFGGGGGQSQDFDIFVARGQILFLRDTSNNQNPHPSKVLSGQNHQA